MKTKIKFMLYFAFVVIAFSACTPEQKANEEMTTEEVEVDVEIDFEKVKSEIQALEDAYAAGEKAKDAEAVAAYYSDDAISYSRNKEPLKGKAAITESIAKNIANDSLGNYNVYKIVDLFVEGDTAVEVGSWTEFSKDGIELQNGNYISYFEKMDGKYLCVRDMSTTTSPVNPAM